MPSYPEIQEPIVSILSGHDIVGLNVPVHNLHPLRLCQGLEHMEPESEDPVWS